MLRSANSELVGFGGVTRPDDDQHDHGTLNLSYHLHPAAWGHSYATELAYEAVRFAFHELAATRVIGLARPWNPASIRVLERVGMTFVRDVTLAGAPSRLHAVTRELWHDITR